MGLFTESKREHKKDIRKKVTVAATIGVAVGAVAGVLLAPHSGKETRNDLMTNIQELPDKAKELSDKAQKKMSEVTEKITEETHKIMCGVKEVNADIQNEMHADSHLKKPIEISEEQVDAFKKKLKP
jgi:gas vesicle protein